jgi:hypothetical protein
MPKKRMPAAERQQETSAVMPGSSAGGAAELAGYRAWCPGAKAR